MFSRKLWAWCTLNTGPWLAVDTLLTSRRKTMVRTVLGGRGGRKGPLPSGQGPPPRHRGWNRLPEPPACSAASGRGERPVLPAPPAPTEPSRERCPVDARRGRQMFLSSPPTARSCWPGAWRAGGVGGVGAGGRAHTPCWRGRGARPSLCARGAPFSSTQPGGTRGRQGPAWQAGVELNLDLKSSARVGREGRGTLQLVRRAGFAKFRAICALPF